MLLRYARMAQGNFGDDVNVELWPELFPDLAGRHPDAHLYGVGTLLGGLAPRWAEDRAGVRLRLSRRTRTGRQLARVLGAWTAVRRGVMRSRPRCATAARSLRRITD